MTVPVVLSWDMHEQHGKKRALGAPLQGGGLEKGLQAPPPPKYTFRGPWGGEFRNRGILYVPSESFAHDRAALLRILCGMFSQGLRHRESYAMCSLGALNGKWRHRITFGDRKEHQEHPSPPQAKEPMQHVI